MSDARYVTVSADQRVAMEDQSDVFEEIDRLAAAYDAAEGQRVEEIRWCETHGERAHDNSTVAGRLWECFLGQCEGEDCDTVEAVIVVPPRTEP